MMNNKRKSKKLWSEVLELFSEFEKIDMISFLYELINIVRINSEYINQTLNTAKSDNSYTFSENEVFFFGFIATLNPEMYVIGPSGDDFKSIVKSYIDREPKTEFEVLRRVSNLVRDIITFTSAEECPQCKSDHLRVFTEVNSEKLYRHCETCFFVDTDDGEIQAQNKFIPANITLLKRAGYLN